jgi:hypothetical protein
MSYASNGVLGALAVVASFGAAQLALGENLTVGMRTAGSPAQAVNRVAKTDRSAMPAAKVAPTQTVAIRVDRFPETSILVRIPANHEARSSVPAPLQFKSDRKMAIACEPMVSVLTEIAKQLQPGRCVT